jgi:hypothetical protein
MAAVLLLLIGAAAGGYLALNHRHSQDVAAAEANVSADSQLAGMDEFKLYADRAFSDEAIRAAQTKADAEAVAQAVRAKKAAEMAKRSGSGTSRSGERPDYGPVPDSCKEYSGNRAIGCALMLEWGYGLDEMPCLDKMWTHESNWRTEAENKSSGAYGIPQALPASKLAKYGDDYRTNPVPQIKWGLDYIKNRYKSPCGAWDFWLAHNWY